jgi:hypothetical protein
VSICPTWPPYFFRQINKGGISPFEHTKVQPATPAARCGGATGPEDVSCTKGFLASGHSEAADLHLDPDTRSRKEFDPY